MSRKGNFQGQFVYTLHGVLAKIILSDFAEQKNGATLDFTQFYETWRFCSAL